MLNAKISINVKEYKKSYVNKDLGDEYGSKKAKNR